MTPMDFIPILGPLYKLLYKLLVDQKRELLRLKGEIATALIHYADVCGHRWTLREGLSNRHRVEAGDTFQRQAAELTGWKNATASTRIYCVLECVHLLPKRSDLETARAALKRISVDLFIESDNAVEEIRESRRDIRKALGLDLGRLNDR